MGDDISDLGATEIKKMSIVNWRHLMLENNFALFLDVSKY